VVQEILIHLGDCKTGSTALQVALAGGRVRIGGERPFYPATLNHNGLAQGLTKRGRAAGKGNPDRLQSLSARLEASQATLGIISAEHFEFVAPETLAAAIADALPQYQGRIRLLAYVRPHAPRLLSSFAEMTKLGQFHGTPDAFLDRAILRGSYHYAPRFARWKAVFGDAFTLRPYLRARLTDGDLVADVASFAARGGTWSIDAHETQNESLGLADLALLRALHDHIPGGPAVQNMGRSNLGRSLGQILSAMPGGGARLQLHRTLAERIMHTYRSDAAALDAAFFPQGLMGVALDRAADDVADTPQSLAAADHFSPADLRQIGLWGDVFARLGDADPDFLSWAVRHPDQRPARMPARSDTASVSVQAKKTASRPVIGSAALDASLLPDGLMTGAGQATPDNQSPAALRLADAAGDILRRIAAADPARFDRAMRSPDGPTSKPRGAKTRRPDSGIRTRAAALTDRIGIGSGARIMRPLGWLSRSLRRALRRIGW
jgi:hypothetical protein